MYLLLADYRGWAFDDSALMPHDPSVVRGRWSPADHGISYQSAGHMIAFEQSSMAVGYDQAKRRRRRKRGGVKRNKAKRAREAAAALLAKEDVDTDAPSEDDDDTPLDSSSSNGAEADGTEIFKEEDFPRLVATVSD